MMYSTDEGLNKTATSRRGIAASSDQHHADDVGSNALGPKDESSEEDEWDSDDFEIILPEELNETGDRQHLPNYHFPKTWDNAYHDSAKALGQVSGASKLYYEAIKSSDVVKAGKSIGGALAASSNRIALETVSLVRKKAGASEKPLPAFAEKWLNQKKEMDKAKERAKVAEEARLNRKLKRELIERGEVVPVGSRPSRRSSRREEGYKERTTPAKSTLRSLADGEWKRPDLERNIEQHDKLSSAEYDDKGDVDPQADHGEQIQDMPYDSSSQRNNPWSTVPVTPSPFSMVRQQTFERVARADRQDGTLRTPVHAAHVFTSLKTPADVRRQLRQPFHAGASLDWRRSSRPTADNEHEGVPDYGVNNADDDDDEDNENVDELLAELLKEDNESRDN